MDKLTKQELEEMWQIYFEEVFAARAIGGDVNDDAAEQCFAINDEYKKRYGNAAYNDWIIRRL